jgi:hypothetical protein
MWCVVLTCLFCQLASLDPALVVEAAATAMARNGAKVSQYNVVWGAFPLARDSGCQKFDSGWCFISA